MTAETEELGRLYNKVMGEYHDWAKGTFIVRQWDGMDGCWTDCTKDVSAEEALNAWSRYTARGTRAVSYDQIDYYKIFPGSTRMLWDGSKGRELFRGSESATASILL
jgi:hypothetical protein